MNIKLGNLLWLAVMFLSLVTFGQSKTLVGLNGKPLEINRDLSIEGSPYLTENWCEGSIVLTSGQKISNLKLKYNAFHDRLEYLMNGQPLFIDNNRLRSFILFNCSESMTSALIFQNGFNNLPEGGAFNFYTIIFNNKSQLIKSIKKSIYEAPEASFNSAKKEKKYITTERYFLIDSLQNGKEIKLNKKSILSVTGLEKGRLNTLLKNRNIDLKKENGLVQLLSILNK